MIRYIECRSLPPFFSFQSFVFVIPAVMGGRGGARGVGHGNRGGLGHTNGVSGTLLLRNIFSSEATL